MFLKERFLLILVMERMLCGDNYIVMILVVVFS